MLWFYFLPTHQNLLIFLELAVTWVYLKDIAIFKLITYKTLARTPVHRSAELAGDLGRGLNQHSRWRCRQVLLIQKLEEMKVL